MGVHAGVVFDAELAVDGARSPSLFGRKGEQADEGAVLSPVVLAVHAAAVASKGQPLGFSVAAGGQKGSPFGFRAHHFRDLVPKVSHCTFLPIFE